MSKSTDDLVQLALAGASLEVAGKSVDHLVRIALSLTPGATLRVVDAGSMSTDTLKRVALAKPGQVILVDVD